MDRISRLARTIFALLLVPVFMMGISCQTRSPYTKKRNSRFAMAAIRACSCSAGLSSFTSHVATHCIRLSLRLSGHGYLALPV